MDKSHENRDETKGEGECEPPRDASSSCDLKGTNLACDASSEGGGGSADDEISGHGEWSTGVLECLSCGKDWKGDLEICVVGTFAPCVLYGINYSGVAELEGHHDSKIACAVCSCCSYVGCWGIACTILVLLPWALLPAFAYIIYTYTAIIMALPRHALRERYNIKGDSDSFYNAIYCCCRGVLRKDLMESRDQAYNRMLHELCHMCALCQEARELRRRGIELPLLTSPVLVPPSKQDMARERWHMLMHGPVWYKIVRTDRLRSNGSNDYCRNNTTDKTILAIM